MYLGIKKMVTLLLFAFRIALGFSLKKTRIKILALSFFLQMFNNLLLLCVARYNNDILFKSVAF